MSPLYAHYATEQSVDGILIYKNPLIYFFLFPTFFVLQTTYIDMYLIRTAAHVLYCTMKILNMHSSLFRGALNNLLF